MKDPEHKNHAVSYSFARDLRSVATDLVNRFMDMRGLLRSA
jgi:hypothetical protein